ncbi:vWA domain-containing protein [Thiocystis violacea]|uniref:vWA domain-containing protein n=1 Tax=Thiocystis violacea TaxID=13725 RepID=UPI0019049A08|nr:vWA domain-containing protein [Thiocystis violacea]MBK1718055.1 hypothetical protein [Thiocystis violacea]
MTPRQLKLRLAQSLGLLFILAWLIPLQVARAATPDVRLLIDVSGSMRQTDPANLRVPALRLVNELLPAGASAGVWLFAEKVEVLTPPGPVDKAWKNRTRSRLDRIHSRGLFTDIEQAIQAATEGWGEAKPDTERHLVLFTDGLVDVSKEAGKSAASRERILSEQLERLKSSNIKVHAIALSDQVDMDLMRLLATQTGGWLETAKDADALQRVFLRMLEQTAAPTTVPLKGNRFEIDDQVSEFTLLAFRAEGAKTRLTDPDGQVIAADQVPPGALWRSEAGYDLVTLSHPKPGAWRLEGVQDPDNRVVVVTDLGIDASSLPNALALGENPRIETWLTDHKQPVTRDDLLRLITVKTIITSLSESATLPREEGQPPPPDEVAASLKPPREQPMERDPKSGRFGMNLDTQALGSGLYQLEILMDGGTFKRQIIKRFKVTGAPLAIRYEAFPLTDADPHPAILLTLSAEPDLIDPASLFGYLLVEGPEDFSEVVDIPKGNRLPLGVKIPVRIPGEYRIKGRFMARTLTNEPIEVQPEPGVVSFDFARPETADGQDQTDTSDKAAVSWLGLGGYLMGGNAFLGLMLGLTWWFMRRPTETEEAAPKKPARKTAAKDKSAKRKRA